MKRKKKKRKLGSYASGSEVKCKIGQCHEGLTKRERPACTVFLTSSVEYLSLWECTREKRALASKTRVQEEWCRERVDSILRFRNKCGVHSESPSSFYFLITYGVCKKRKYCNRMSGKNSLLLMKCSCFVCLRRQNDKKKIPLSVCLSVWLSGCTYVDPGCEHNNFRRS